MPLTAARREPLWPVDPDARSSFWLNASQLLKTARPKLLDIGMSYGEQSNLTHDPYTRFSAKVWKGFIVHSVTRQSRSLAYGYQTMPSFWKLVVEAVSKSVVDSS